MKVFTGTITETYTRKVAILAESKEEADEILQELYLNEDLDEIGPDDWDEWYQKIDKEIDPHNLDNDIPIYNKRGITFSKEAVVEAKECDTL